VDCETRFFFIFFISAPLRWVGEKTFVVFSFKWKRLILSISNLLSFIVTNSNPTEEVLGFGFPSDFIDPKFKFGGVGEEWRSGKSHLTFRRQALFYHSTSLSGLTSLGKSENLFPSRFRLWPDPIPGIWFLALGFSFGESAEWCGGRVQLPRRRKLTQIPIPSLGFFSGLLLKWRVFTLEIVIRTCPTWWTRERQKGLKGE